MVYIKRFEDIQGWQGARILNRMIFEITASSQFSKNFGLIDQLRRASISIMANIAEGFDCDSPIEFSRFLGIARRSAVEVQSLLYVALDACYLTQDEFDMFYQQANKTKALIGGLRQSLKNRLNPKVVTK
jgi:four helix bundle protein